MAQLTDAQLLLLFGQYLPDNDDQLIDPIDLRYVLAQLVESKVSMETLAQFAHLASPRLTGVPQVPTAPAGTDSDQVASTAFVQAALSAIASGKNLGELVLPQDVQGGVWYLTSTGIWEARRNFSAVADPVNGPNWLLKASFGGQSAPINAASILDATDAGRAMLTAPSASAQRSLVNNPQIPAGKYGDHPSFNSEDGPAGSWAWVLKAILALQGAKLAQRPAAPTSGQVDDTNDTFSFLANQAYPSFSQYKVNGLPGIVGPAYLDATNSYVQGNRIYVRVVGAVAKGGLAVYVAGSGNMPDGEVLTNADPFTGVAVGPPLTTGDTVKPEITFTVPAAGATLTPNSQVLLTVIANDNVAVQGVTFTNGATGTVIGVGARNGSTYTFPYTTGVAGSLSLVATATDAAGNSQSATVSVTVASATTTPTPELTAALAISLATLTLGAPVSYTVTPTKGTAPYSYEVVATNSFTGQQFIIGNTRTGNWTPTAAGDYEVKATVTDSSSPAQVAESAIRYLRVVEAANRIPVADAGQDLTVSAGTTSVALMGTASDPDQGDTLTYAWRYVTGPNVPTGLPATTLNVVVSNLVTGTYQFGFRSTDNHGAQSVEDYVLLTVQAVGNKGIANVFVATGQSNVEGPADGGDLMKFPELAALNLDRKFERFKIFNATTNNIEQLQFGGLGVGNQMGYTYDEHFNGYGVMFGPELGMADTWEKNNTGTAFLAKFCWGGRPIADFLPGGQYRDDLDYAVNSLVAKLKAEGYTPIIRGILWNQWEEDAARGATKAQYYDNLETLFTSMEWLPSNAKRVIVLASGAFDPNGFMRAAQLQYLAAHSQARWLDSRDFERRADQLIHYNGRGEYQQGKQFFDALAAPDNSPPVIGGSFTFSANWQNLVFSPIGANIAVDAANTYSYTGNLSGLQPGGLSSLKPVANEGPYGIKMTLKPKVGACVMLGFNATNEFDGTTLDYGFIFNIKEVADYEGITDAAPGPYLLQRIVNGKIDTYRGDFAHALTTDADYVLALGVGPEPKKLYLLERLPGATNYTIIDTLGLPTGVLYPQFHLINYDVNQFPNAVEGLYKPQYFGMS